MKKIISMLLITILTITSIVGCSSVNESSEEQNVQENLVITDHAGREIEVTGEYERIVSGYYISSSMLISLGLEDKLVGIEAKAEKRPIYKLAAPQLLELPNVGTAKEFNLEGCIALEPDLVILPKRLSEQAQTLTDMGITTIVVNPENEQLLRETIDMISKATGTQEKAQELISYYDEKYLELSEITKNIENKTKVYLAGESDILKTATGEMYQNSVIENAGGENVSKEITDSSWATISYEQLINYNPDIIVIIPESEFTKEDVLNNAELKDINAVKNSKVFEMPSNFEAWDSPVPSGILGTMWLASIINEDSYSFDKFKEDVYDFYNQFYNFEIDKELVTK